MQILHGILGIFGCFLKPNREKLIYHALTFSPSTDTLTGYLGVLL